MKKEERYHQIFTALQGLCAEDAEEILKEAHRLIKNVSVVPQDLADHAVLSGGSKYKPSHF